MRLFTATLATETNSFVATPTGLGDFARCQLVRGGIDGQPPGLWTTPALVWQRGADARGWHLAHGPHAFAEPGGPVAAAAYKGLRDEILAALAAAMPVDGVLLGLHGAMLARGCDDCEGDLLAGVRALVGRDCAVGVLLDLHAHLTTAMLDHATLIIAYKEYPHTDYGERAAEVFELVAATLEGRIRPVMAAARTGTMGLFPTTRTAAMRALVDRLSAAEGRDGLLSCSLIHGFPWGDVAETGVVALVVADGAPARAAAAAADLAARFRAVRAEAALTWTALPEALERAAAATAHPVLLADTADQVGGGAPGDATHLLRAVLARGLDGAVFAPFWDPLAVYACRQAGVGAPLTLRVGGKAEAHSGQPVDLDVTVAGLFPAATQEGLNGEAMAIGDVAVVAGRGVTLILTSERTNLFTPSLFTRHGIDPAACRYVCVKGLYRYWDRFAPLCAQMILVATPGACDPAFARLPYTKLPRPIWPLDPTA